MRSCSLGGTPPRKTSASVPRLTPLKSACTIASPAAATGRGSVRISPVPGAAIQKALARSCSMRVMPAAPDADALRGSALASILPAVVLGGLGAAALTEAAGLSQGYAWRAVALLLAGAALLLAGLRDHPHARFGLANQLTLL